MKNNSEKLLLKIIEECRLGKAKKKDWEELYRYCFPQIYLYLKANWMKFSIPIVITELEDITQDVFIKLIEKFPEVRFHSLEDFNGYLYVVCKHYLIDFLKRTKYERFVVSLEDSETLISSLDYPHQERVYEKRKLITLLLEAIENLPIYCKKILYPMIKEEKTLAETAKCYEIPEGSIYNQYKR